MKKNFKRIFLFFVVIVSLAQIPFVYRRIQTGTLAEKLRLERDASQPKLPRADGFDEYKGVIHVHTSLGGHSTGGFDELTAAAAANDLDFVVMTEHVSTAYDTAALTLNGIYGKTLFVGGNEGDTSDGDRMLVVPGGGDVAGLHMLPTKTAFEKTHANNRLVLVAYPEAYKTWDADFDGAEVFSLNTNSKNVNPFLVLFDLIWSFPSYPELTTSSYFVRPNANLQKYDEVAANRRISLFAGLCAHSNIGYHLLGDDVGNKPIGFKIDPYAMVFRLARLHLVTTKGRPLTRESLIEIFKKGNFFNGFDVIGDSTGFSFTAKDGDATKTMGDEVTLGPQTTLTASAPMPARFVVFKNGERFFEQADTTAIAFNVTERSAYRVEVYRDVLGSPYDKMPWIISNPIYVR
jgi:hypothetical protein